MIGHWLNTELWGPMWPNIAAPSLWTLAGIGLAHWRTRVHLRRHHEELKQHVSETINGSEGK